MMGGAGHGTLMEAHGQKAALVDASCSSLLRFAGRGEGIITMATVLADVMVGVMCTFELARYSNLLYVR
jgi:hypothetical protein